MAEAGLRPMAADDDVHSETSHTNTATDAPRTGDFVGTVDAEDTGTVASATAEDGEAPLMYNLPDTIFMAGVEKLKVMQIFEIFNLIPGIKCKRVEFLSNDTCNVSFPSPDIASTALQTMLHYNELIPPKSSKKEGPGIYRIRNGYVAFRKAISNDGREQGFKPRFRAGHVVREFRTEVQRRGEFFETPKAAMVSGNFDKSANPKKRELFAKWVDEMDSDGEDPEDILDLLMKLDRKVYRFLDRQERAAEQSVLQDLEQQERQAQRIYNQVNGKGRGWRGPVKRGRDYNDTPQWPMPPPMFPWMSPFPGMAQQFMPNNGPTSNLSFEAPDAEEVTRREKRAGRFGDDDYDEDEERAKRQRRNDRFED